MLLLLLLLDDDDEVPSKCDKSSPAEVSWHMTACENSVTTLGGKLSASRLNLTSC